MTGASLKQSNLNQVDFTAATLIDTYVVGASMANLNLTDAQIFNTGIAVGGSEEYPEINWIKTDPSSSLVFKILVGFG